MSRANGSPLQDLAVDPQVRVDLQRMFNVAVRKKFLAANPCSGVEFPVRVKGLFRPHYMSWAGQGKIETQTPRYLRNMIHVISETGLRVYKELASMKKSQVDLDLCSRLDPGRENGARRC